MTQEANALLLQIWSEGFTQQPPTPHSHIDIRVEALMPKVLLPPIWRKSAPACICTVSLTKWTLRNLDWMLSQLYSLICLFVCLFVFVYWHFAILVLSKIQFVILRKCDFLHLLLLFSSSFIYWLSNHFSYIMQSLSSWMVGRICIMKWIERVNLPLM